MFYKNEVGNFFRKIGNFSRSNNKHFKKAIDSSLTQYYFDSLKRLNWINFMNLRQCFRYELYENGEPFDRISILDELKLVVETLFKNKKVVGIFLNYFTSGKDRIPYHKDSYQSDVLTLSLGGTRKFRIQNDLTKKSTGFDLEDGDFFYFNEEFNKTYKHSITPTKKAVSDRISVEFFLQNLTY